ncbi:MAG: hypothetical protein WAT19_03835 [Ferruginibacter sp.]
MKQLQRLVTVCVFAILLFSCSRKTTSAASEATSSEAIKEDASAKKTTAAPVLKKVKTPVPKVISLNDAAARKSADGRLYYDLEGRRYWKNYKDGKYYLFNKNMYGNPDFRPG